MKKIFTKNIDFTTKILMMTVGTKKNKKLPRNLFGSKECVISMPEYHKNAINSSIFLKIQSHFKVPINAARIPLVPKNYQINILVHYKSKY